MKNFFLEYEYLERPQKEVARKKHAGQVDFSVADALLKIYWSYFYEKEPPKMTVVLLMPQGGGLCKNSNACRGYGNDLVISCEN